MNDLLFDTWGGFYANIENLDAANITCIPIKLRTAMMHEEMILLSSGKACQWDFKKSSKLIGRQRMLTCCARSMKSAYLTVIALPTFTLL